MCTHAKSASKWKKIGIYLRNYTSKDISIKRKVETNKQKKKSDLSKYIYLRHMQSRMKEYLNVRKY